MSQKSNNVWDIKPRINMQAIQLHTELMCSLDYISEIADFVGDAAEVSFIHGVGLDMELDNFDLLEVTDGDWIVRYEDEVDVYDTEDFYSLFALQLHRPTSWTG